MRLIVVAAIVFAIAGAARAQDQTSPDELNRKYQDALTQLKAAQDRKNELATENERLTARVAELEKALETAKQDRATFAEQTFRLRALNAAWQSFLAIHPAMLERWRIFIESSPLAFPPVLPEFLDPTNPLPSEPPPALSTAPATAPATTGATQPASAATTSP